jgi:TrmH family RNA methyltransferase
VHAALEAGAPVDAIYVDSSRRGDAEVVAVLARASEAGVRTFDLGPGVMEKVADAVSPQAVCAVVGFIDRPLVEVLAASESGSEYGSESGSALGAGSAPTIVCVDVRDPGNLGAMLRVADASGAPGVICCGSSVDLYNPKVVRASAGSIFHVPIALAEDVGTTIESIEAAGVRTLATVARGGKDHVETDLTGRVALLFGNEASGLDEALVTRASGAVTISMPGRAESLNVAMAAAVLCFESARQRKCLYSG